MLETWGAAFRWRRRSGARPERGFKESFGRKSPREIDEFSAYVSERQHLRASSSRLDRSSSVLKSEPQYDPNEIDQILGSCSSLGTSRHASQRRSFRTDEPLEFSLSLSSRDSSLHASALESSVNRRDDYFRRVSSDELVFTAPRETMQSTGSLGSLKLGQSASFSTIKHSFLSLPDGAMRPSELQRSRQIQKGQSQQLQGERQVLHSCFSAWRQFVRRQKARRAILINRFKKAYRMHDLRIVLTSFRIWKVRYHSVLVSCLVLLSIIIEQHGRERLRLRRRVSCSRRITLPGNLDIEGL